MLNSSLKLSFKLYLILSFNKCLKKAYNFIVFLEKLLNLLYLEYFSFLDKPSDFRV